MFFFDLKEIQNKAKSLELGKMKHGHNINLEILPPLIGVTLELKQKENICFRVSLKPLKLCRLTRRAQLQDTAKEKEGPLFD